ncbi:peptidase, partial [Enterococcus faecalis]|nr:peptidase [Enterococcus faecalis]
NRNKDISKTRKVRSVTAEIDLGKAQFNPKAELVVTKPNMIDYFEVAGSATGDTTNPTTLTQDIPGQAGSLLLNHRVDMNESIYFKGRINLGNKYEGYSLGGRAGGDGISVVFTTSDPGTIGLSGASIGLGGIPNSFGFKLDTWHNTSNPAVNQKASSDPKFPGYQNGAFGAFYSTDGAGKAITLLQDTVKLQSNPVNNEFKDFTIMYNGKTKEMIVTYDGQTFSRNVFDFIQKTRLTTKQKPGSEELSFAIFASTGSGTNLQQVDLEEFRYTAGGSYIKLLYIDDINGKVVQKEKIIQGKVGDNIDLSDKIQVLGYDKVRSNVETAQGYVRDNTVKFLQGIQTITYTYSNS